MDEGAPKIRIDKWLWHARFFKTRSLAAKQVGAGHVRLNGTKTLKPAQNVAPGDVLTFVQAKVIRVVRVEAIGTRRGPAPEAQGLYFDMTEKQEKIPANPKFEGKGRPDKKARRALDLTRKQDTL
ncbi:RNA-binding S4 domain-containing protein [Leisingera methylohalidivorans]|uniref:tRNA synthetase RNA-binding protein n=1 Tax=Leisingera methylohalidivorans DSM 14336 TaxID=999552 RepID=V9VRT8_9RHOB|nr:RNA-binding S4 domain-containing protein [Leisingera methylohalidivorans]AHD01461.1 tRNA synthetase RNA-binding protein [Leisingera methylohalidivorans DSM 14336]